MKTSLTSFDIYTLISELQSQAGGWIGKVYQPARDKLIIRIKTKEDTCDLLITNGKWMALTQKESLDPGEPTTFAMTCRKYLYRGKIQAIRQLEFEHIIILDVQKDALYHLIIELFSSGNIILVGEDQKIILSLRRQTWSHRAIQPGELYTPPPPRANPFTLDFPAFTHLVQQAEGDIVHALIVNLNLGGQWGEEICARASLPKTMGAKELDDTALRTLYNVFQDVQGLFTGKKFDPVIVKKDDTPLDVSPFPLTKYSMYPMEKKETFNQAVHDYFSCLAPTGGMDDTGVLHRIQSQQQEAVQQLKAEAEDLQKEAEFIYTHYRDIHNALTHALSTPGDKKAPRTLKVTITEKDGTTRDIQLNPYKTVNENAALKYEKVKKAREKLTGALKALDFTQQQLRDTHKKQTKKTPGPIHKKGKTFWFEQYRWFISSDGHVVIGGKDAQSNEKIVKKYLKKEDRYIHANIKGASSCIVKASDIHDNPLPITVTTLHEACQFAVVYSKAWKHFGEMDAYWVNPEQVSKSPPPGEYLPRGSFMITGKRTFYRCPMEYGIGLITLGDETKVMGAPPHVSKTLQKWVIIIPGEDTKDTAAHKIATHLNVPVDTVLRVLPPGGISIREVNP